MCTAAFQTTAVMRRSCCTAIELLAGDEFHVAEPVWFKAGAQIFTEGGLDYLCNSGLVRAQPVLATLGLQAIMMGGAAAYRVAGGPMDEGLGSLNPGGAFDPVGMHDGPKSLAALNAEEVKSGCLAMFSMLSYYIRGLGNKNGPIGNWAFPMADTLGVNRFTTAGTAGLTANLLNQQGSVAICATLGHVSDNLAAWHIPAPHRF